MDMGCSEGSGAPTPRNIRFLRAVIIAVRPSRTADTIALEVIDQHGDGFCAELSPELALDACLKLVGSVARLRGYIAS
jgi:hypothetical protein